MALRREILSYVGTGAIGGMIGYYAGVKGLLGIQSEGVERERDLDQQPPEQPTEQPPEQPTEQPPEQPTEQGQLEFAYPAQSGLAATKDVIYAVENDDILQIDRSNGDVAARIDAPTGERAGLAFGGGSLWFSDAVGDTYAGEVVELNQNTGDVRSQISTPYDAVALAFGEGSLWVCNITANTVVEYAPDGTSLNEFDTGGPTGSTEARGLAYADGSLYVGTRDTNAITEFATDGTSMGEIDVPDRPYRGLAATSEVLLGPDENDEVTVLRQFDRQG